jgi:signal transduction histidine kinase
MRSLKLHTKTTLLVSIITMAVLAATLWLVSARVVDLVREDERALAELRAASLAEHISRIAAPRDPEELARAATLIRGARPQIVAVRIWERSGEIFVERAAASGSIPAEEIPQETRDALRSGVASRLDTFLPAGADSSYRVFAPIKDGERVSGAVEIVERLDNTLSVARRYAPHVIWMALLAVILIAGAISLLFRHLIYRPLERLLDGIERAKAGALDAQVEVRARDEIGRLTADFNRMLVRLDEMTREREAQQEILRERVRDATSELQRRNDQLGEANLELWRTSQRLSEVERLAAAGQTAAQFAHEVGTPLNLISCHVELLRGDLGRDPKAAEARTLIISEQIERIERIVRRLLDRTRIEATELKPLDPGALLERVSIAIAPAISARDVSLNKEFSPNLPLIAGEADHLQQVFINLINNALDAMPDGGELRLSAAHRNQEVIFEVADTGQGMSAETRARIFDPLYTTKERERGTGLGLAIVSQVIAEHNAEIEVESEEGCGALFRLRFPVLSEVRSGTPASAATGAGAELPRNN